MHFARRRFGTASRSEHVAALHAAGGCSCPHHTSKPGGATAKAPACPSWVPHDLTSALKANIGAVEVVNVLCDTLGSVVPLPGVGPAVIALGAVITTLASDCDMGSTLQSEARQASIGAKIGVIACTVGSIFAPPSALALAPIGVALAALVPVFDALGKGKSPKLSDVANVAGTLGGVAGVAGVDTSSWTGPLSEAGSTLASLPEAQQVASLVPKATATTSTDVQAGFLQAARRALADAVAEGHDVDAAMSHFTQRQPGVDGNSRSHVIRVVAKWKQAGSPADVERVRQIWDAEVPAHPFVDKDIAVARAKARSLERAGAGTSADLGSSSAPQVAFKGPPINLPKINAAGELVLMRPSRPTPASTHKPLSKNAKIGLGIGGAAALALVVKLAVFS